MIISDDVMDKSGICSYVFNGKERHLNIRKFTGKDRIEAYECQGGVCPVCKGAFAKEEMVADHTDPGTRAAKQTPRIARCYVRKITAGSRGVRRSKRG